MDIAFSCPHCKQHIEAPPEMSGTAVNCPTCKGAILVPTPAMPILLKSDKPPLTGRLVAGILGGLLMAILAANIAGVLFGNPLAKPPDNAPGVSAIFFFLAWGAGIYTSTRARTTGKAWRWNLVPCAVLSFALPLAALIMTANTAAQLDAKGAHMAAGVTAMAGTVAATIAGVFAFFMGAIFLTIGLLVGREKKAPQ